MQIKRLLHLKLFDAYSPLLPLTASLLLFAFVISLWWTLEQREHRAIKERVLMDATNFSRSIELNLLTRILALQRFSKRMENAKSLQKEIFEAEAQAYINDFPGFEVIEWVDSDHHILWVVPEVDNEILKGLNLRLDKKQFELLTLAKEKREPIVSSIVNLIQGAKGVRIYLSIFQGKEHKGYIVAIINSQEWLDDILYSQNQTLSESLIASVYVNGMLAYESHKKSYSRHESFQAVINNNLFHQNITIMAEPTKAYVSANKTFIPQLTLITGSIFSLLIGLISYLFQRNAKEKYRLLSMQDTLTKTTKTLTLATQAGHAGIWSWDITSDALHWNDLMYLIYDIPREATLDYSTWRNRLHPDDVEFTEKLLFAAAAGSAKFETVFRIILNDGSIKYISAAAQVEHDETGKATVMTGVNMDITEQTKAQTLLAEEKEKLTSIIEGTNVGTWEWNVQTGELKLNEKWANMVGYTLDELAPISIKTWENIAHPDDLAKSNELLQMHFRGEIPYYDFEARMKHKNGHWIWVHDRGRVSIWTRDKKPVLMFGTHQDITQRKQDEEKIKRLATHDPLTNLPTRRLAEDRLMIAIAAARRDRKKIGVLFIDLDGFKPVNDQYGHKAGDELLQEVARCLTTCLRDSDTAARIGGDEFLVILPSITETADIERVARKILDFLSHPIYLHEGIVTISASVGIAIYPDHSEDPVKLIRFADNAMYQIKNKTKNSYAFYSYEP